MHLDSEHEGDVSNTAFRVVFYYWSVFMAKWNSDLCASGSYNGQLLLLFR